MTNYRYFTFKNVFFCICLKCLYFISNLILFNVLSLNGSSEYKSIAFQSLWLDRETHRADRHYDSQKLWCSLFYAVQFNLHSHTWHKRQTCMHWNALNCILIRIHSSVKLTICRNVDKLNKFTLLQMHFIGRLRRWTALFCYIARAAHAKDAIFYKDDALINLVMGINWELGWHE